MAFAVRRPFALTVALKQIPKASPTPIRAFHQASPFKSANAFFSSKPASPITAVTKSQNTFQRTITRPASTFSGPDTGNLTQRLLYGGAIFGGTILAINLVFNRETREDGGMPPFERSFLNDTFLHTGLGLGIIGVAATALHRSGWSYRLMSMNPWLVIGGSVALSFGLMYTTRSIPPEK